MELAEAPSILMLEVTQGDIDGAKPSDGAHCPIARALKRQLGVAVVEAMCHTELTALSGDGEVIAYAGSRAIDDFMDRFDNFGVAGMGTKYRTPVKPTKFRLRLVNV